MVQVEGLVDVGAGAPDEQAVAVNGGGQGAAGAQSQGARQARLHGGAGELRRGRGGTGAERGMGHEGSGRGQVKKRRGGAGAG